MKINIDNRGFSLSEIKKAELSLNQVKSAGILYDTRRKTCKDENVKMLATLVKRNQQPKDENKKIEADKLKIQSFDELEGLSSKLKSKLHDLGVETPADFLAEDDEDLVVFLNVDLEEIKAWKKQIQG